MDLELLQQPLQAAHREWKGGGCGCNLPPPAQLLPRITNEAKERSAREMIFLIDVAAGLGDTPAQEGLRGRGGGLLTYGEV